MMKNISFFPKIHFIYHQYISTEEDLVFKNIILNYCKNTNIKNRIILNGNDFINI